MNLLYEQTGEFKSFLFGLVEIYFTILKKIKSIFRYPYFFNLSGCRIVSLFRAHEQEIYVLLEKFVLIHTLRLMIQIIRAKAFRIPTHRYVPFFHASSAQRVLLYRVEVTQSQIICDPLSILATHDSKDVLHYIICRINCERILKETFEFEEPSRITRIPTYIFSFA